MNLENGFSEISRYTKYSNYSDKKIYRIDEDRNIPEIKEKILRGDERSQYITFEMPRYYDGVDFIDKQIYVRWFNDSNVESGGMMADICDARYNDECIRFAWLLEPDVAKHAGPVVFFLYGCWNK